MFMISVLFLYGDSQEESIDISDIDDTSSLWELFMDNYHSETGVNILTKLGVLAKGNRGIINSLNNYLIIKNLLYKSGESVDYTIVSACISAIMELGDSSSYPALFSVLYSGYPDIISSEAKGALEVIPGNLYQFLEGVVLNSPPEEKIAAYKMGEGSDKLNVSQRGQLAELALIMGINAAGDDIEIKAMRYLAVLLLTQLKWTRANDLAIQYYYIAQTDYFQNAMLKDRFIEAIAFLGAVGDSDAALVLGLQLGLINARTGSTGSFDVEITMAIIRALGNIGYNAVFDHLLNVSYLSYPEEIQAAAREAVARLKW
jgi:hypothetical protein